MTTELLRTPLYDWHVAHGGRMVDFAGWSMPVQYASIADEHNATRNAVGVFDISHMGRLQFFGNDVPKFLDSIVTRRVSDLKPDEIRYALVCNDVGGILDDVLVYSGTPNHTPPYSMVVNASNREKIVDWLNSKLPEANTSPKERTVWLGDDTSKTAMIAVQGPKAIEVLTPLVNSNSDFPPIDLSAIRYYRYVRPCPIGNLLSRTGYTGEDGFEIICENEDAGEVWEQVIAAAHKVGGAAVGLGARDTLRLEAAMPLYGHELSEAINPIQAGLNFAVNLKDREFIGSETLKKFAADKSQPVRIGLTLDGRRVPRQGCPVLQNGAIIGEVTSGTFSPTLQKPIAMAYVQPTAQAIGTQLEVDLRGTKHPATVVPLPFYQRQKS
ncbi:MAG: glycine cleavage system aminomethyltransferase GcvT [Pirellulales bacterium]